MSNTRRAAIAPVFIIAVLIIAMRTPLLPGRWLWALFIVFGVCQISVNWTTGQVGLNPISIAVFASGFVKPGPYGPVIISSSFPLGAAVFLWKRRALAKTPPQPASGTATADGSTTGNDGVARG